MGNQAKVYKEDPNTITVDDGGVINVLSGGAINIASGGDIVNNGDQDVKGYLKIKSNAVVSVESGGSIDCASGGLIIMRAGAKITPASGTQAVHITDASVAHALNAAFSDTEVEGALDALGAKINSILAALEGAGILAAS